MLLKVLQRSASTKALVGIKIGHAVGQCHKRTVVSNQVDQLAEGRRLNFRDLAVQRGFRTRSNWRTDATHQIPCIEAAYLTREVVFRGYEKPNGDLCQTQLDGEVFGLSVWLVGITLGFAFAA